MIVDFCKWLVVVFGMCLFFPLLRKEVLFIAAIKKAERKGKCLRRPIAWDCLPGQGYQPRPHVGPIVRLTERPAMRSGFGNGPQTTKPAIEPKGQGPVKPIPHGGRILPPDPFL